MPCEKARLLAGSWMCPCHGMADSDRARAKPVRSRPRQPRARVPAPDHDEIGYMLSGLVAVLAKIRDDGIYEPAGCDEDDALCEAVVKVLRRIKETT